jgi:peptide/nickel transport system permease protein
VVYREREIRGDQIYNEDDAMPLVRFLGFRLLGAIAMLLAVSALIFVMTDVLPGDVATRILGRNPDPERLAILRERLGLNQPLLLRYATWIGGLVTGDFGVSLVSGQAVGDIIGRRLYNSFLLSIFAFALYLPIAVIPAVIQASNRDKPADHVLSGLTLAVLSIPDFLLGTLLLILFASILPIAPARSTIDSAMGLGEIVHALVLPALTIALVMGTYAVRYLRDSLIEALDAEHIRMARLNGISERSLLWKHALPNALIPALNITSLNLTYLFGGVVVVEQVFAFPGFGSLLVGSLMQLDIPVVQATVLIAASIYILGNLFADIGSVLLNPRLRHAS